MLSSGKGCKNAIKNGDIDLIMFSTGQLPAFSLTERTYYAVPELQLGTMQSQNCSWGSAVFSYASSILQREARIVHRLKQNIFSLVRWKRSLTPLGNISHAQQYRFFTRPDVRTGLPWKIPLNIAFRDHNSPFCIWGAVMGKFLNSPNWETV